MVEAVLSKLNLISLVCNTMFTVSFASVALHVYCTLKHHLDKFTQIMIFMYVAGFAGKHIDILIII